MDYTDILYEIRGGAAWITINRPEKYNAFRGRTVDELIHAFQTAGWDPEVGVIVLTGAGDKAFCTGGDQSAHDGQYDGRGVIGLPIDELQSLIRDVPKPVIARVNGFAIGGGNVLELARSGADVNAVVSLHGDLATTMPAKKGDIKAAVFVIHGSKDPVAPKADRDALEAEMDGAGANWQMLDFGGRLHSFAEEETMMKGVAEYHAGAAHQTFRMLDEFIQDAFNKKL